MKICAFTQTYGARNLELDVTLINQLKIDLYSDLDHFHLNYHNSKLNEKYNILFQHKIKNVTFEKYDDVPYAYTIHATLKKLKTNGFTDIAFIQDDHYFIQHENAKFIIQDTIDFYKNNNYPIVYFGSRFNKNEFKIIKNYKMSNNEFEIYDSTQFPNHIYPYDDSPHLANIDFLLENLYPLSVTNLDVWNLEIRNTNHFKNNKIIFASGSKPCVYCANFSGRNIAKVIPQDEKIKYILGKKIEYDECKQFYERLQQ